MKRSVFFYLVAICFQCLFMQTGYTYAQIFAANGKAIADPEMDRFLKQKMDSLGMPGISIVFITAGKIVYHRALGIANTDTKKIVDRETIFEAASLSKPVFTIFVLKMVEEGKLDLDKPLYQYLPYPDIAYDERYKLITTRMVLTHTSGLPNSRYYDPADSSRHIKPGTLYLKFTPGTYFSYSGEGFLYLSMVIAHLNSLTLKNLDELFQQEVAIPMGMQHSHYTWNPYMGIHDAKGHKNGKPVYRGWPTSLPTDDSTSFNAMGGLHTEAMDYARLLIGIMDYKCLKKEYIDEMLRAQYHFTRRSDGLYWYANDSAYSLSLGIKASKYGPYFTHSGDNLDFQSGFNFYMNKKSGYVFFTNCDQGREFFEELSLFLTEGR